MATPAMDEPRAAAAVFTAYEADRIEQFLRFLIHVADPDIALVAARVGYDADEHEIGWREWRIAAGVDIPFHDYLSEASRGVALASGDAQAVRVRELDGLENRWFPAVRNGIRRCVEPNQRETVLAAFFQDMPQQPEGPAVIGSMDKFLVRLDGLRKSDVPGAAEAFAGLQKKGLTDELLARIRQLIDAARQSAPAGKPARPARKEPKQPAITAADRRAAYERLNLWYIDWADTLRWELVYQQQVRLGLTTRKGGRRPEEDQPEPAEPAKPVVA